MAFQLQQQLNHWYRHPANQPLLEMQAQVLATAMKEVFGLYLVQLGAPWPCNLLTETKVNLQVLCERMPVRMEGMASVVADLDYLPFGREAVDVFVLPHTLEVVEDPYHLLRQVDRMLVLDGHVVIVGMNPWNWKNQRQRLLGSARQVFRQAHLIRMHRLIDWLNLLGYEIRFAQHTALNMGTGWGERLEYVLEKAGVHPGRFYFIVAQKRSVPLTPVGLNWKLANWLPINKGAWVPSRRLGHQRQETKHETG